jgi:hypothetical protein
MLALGIATFLLVIITIIGVLIFGGNGAGEGDDNISDTTNEANQGSDTGTENEDGQLSGTPSDGLQNALDIGNDFLALHPMSRSSLVEQLEHEGFSQEVIDSAMREFDNTVDWNEQAVIIARRYLDTSDAFTEASLAEQLVFAGFTQSEANHGANVAFNE